MQKRNLKVIIEVIDVLASKWLVGMGVFTAAALVDGALGVFSVSAPASHW